MDEFFLIMRIKFFLTFVVSWCVHFISLILVCFLFMFALLFICKPHNKNILTLTLNMPIASLLKYQAQILTTFRDIWEFCHFLAVSH